MWKDVDIWMRKSPTSDFLHQLDIEAIKNSLYNICTTMPGSRRMLPTFACGLYNLLFEPIDERTANAIGHEILGAIRIWEPRIQVQNINVHPDPDNNRYDISLVFMVAATKEAGSLSWVLNV